MAASIGFSQRSGDRALYEQLLWWLLTLLATALFLGLKLVGMGHDPSTTSYIYEQPILDTILGLTVMCPLIALAKAQDNVLPLVVHYAGEHPVFVHAPILSVLAVACRARCRQSTHTRKLILGGPILSAGLSYLSTSPSSARSCRTARNAQLLCCPMCGRPQPGGDHRWQ